MLPRRGTSGKPSWARCHCNLTLDKQNNGWMDVKSCQTAACNLAVNSEKLCSSTAAQEGNTRKEFQTKHNTHNMVTSAAFVFSLQLHLSIWLKTTILTDFVMVLKGFEFYRVTFVFNVNVYSNYHTQIITLKVWKWNSQFCGLTAQRDSLHVSIKKKNH